MTSHGRRIHVELEPADCESSDLGEDEEDFSRLLEREPAKVRFCSDGNDFSFISVHRIGAADSCLGSSAVPISASRMRPTSPSRCSVDMTTYTPRMLERPRGNPACPSAHQAVQADSIGHMRGR